MFTDIKPGPKPKREDGKDDRRRHVDPPTIRNTRLCLSTSTSRRLGPTWQPFVIECIEGLFIIGGKLKPIHVKSPNLDCFIRALHCYIFQATSSYSNKRNFPQHLQIQLEHTRRSVLQSANY